MCCGACIGVLRDAQSLAFDAVPPLGPQQGNSSYWISEGALLGDLAPGTDRTSCCGTGLDDAQGLCIPERIRHGPS